MITYKIKKVLNSECKKQIKDAIEGLRQFKKLKLNDNGLNSLILEEIKELTAVVKQPKRYSYLTNIYHRSLELEFESEELPNDSKIEELKQEHIRELKLFRDELKSITEENKNFLGYKYKTTGGVFIKENSIIEAQKTMTPEIRIGQDKVPYSKSRNNYVGFELEFMSTNDRQHFNNLFIAAGLAGKVKMKSDSSIRVEDPYRFGHELTLLSLESEVEEIITKVCSILNSNSVNVNNSCGFHMHLDVRNKDAYKLYNNLVMSLPLLTKLVPYNRVKGDASRSYCAYNTQRDLNQIYPNGLDGGCMVSRYHAINPESISKYKTIEVRLHSGTTNANKIINWWNICKVLINQGMLTNEVSTLEDFSSLCQDEELNKYVDKRMKRFSSSTAQQIDTKIDDFLDLAV